MKIVQTFWSGKKSLLEHDYGWLSPEYHLMGWALSSLRLRKYYQDLELYTDDHGANLLVHKLKLPFTAVHQKYDSINHINNKLWALPKILTYQAQREPFLHVDGDVFIWERFSPAIENSDLVVQNFETGTEYYERLIGKVKTEINYIPNFLRRELRQKNISSYNAGVLGGNDIDFIKQYCEIALKIVNRNNPTSNDNPGFTNFNILFEQILFFAFCARAKKEVTCVLSDPFTDNGYTKDKIADWSAAPFRLKFLHLVGQKKRDLEVCELLSRALLREYPDYFFRIKALFSNNHINFHGKIRHFISREEQGNTFHAAVTDPFIRTKKTNGSKVKANIFAFESELVTANKNWESISGEYLYAAECRANDYFAFFFQTRDFQLDTVIERNEHLLVIENSFEWCIETKQKINQRLIDESTGYATGLAILPQLFGPGYREVVIDELAYNILALLDQPKPLKYIISKLAICFPNSYDKNESYIYELILIKLRNLFLNKCLYIKEIA